jgi:cytochrome P450
MELHQPRSAVAPLTSTPGARAWGVGSRSRLPHPATFPGSATTPPDPAAPFGFDLRSPDFIANPYPVYARLRDEAPVLQIGHRWVVSRYQDVTTVLQNPSFGRTGYEDILFRAFGVGPLYESFRRWMLFFDGPDHVRLRGLVMRAFTPRAVERLRAAIQRLVDSLLDDLQASSGGDLVASFAYPLPVLVICEMLGVPPEDRGQFGALSDCVGRALQVGALTPEMVAEGNDAVEKLTAYFRTRVADQRLHPRDNLLAGLIAAEDENGRLSEDELLATVVLLFFAGHETTVNLVGNGVLALLNAPEQWRLLVVDPTLARRVVEEVLRLESPVQLATRIALTDAELGGIPIPSGAVVMALIGSANRDPARFPNADRLDLQRAETHHLAFAVGPHYCLGAALARLEAEVAFSSLAQRFPDLRLATSAVTWRPNNLLRGPQRLDVLA